MLGKKLGCYRILEIIDRGQVAVIYKAQDEFRDRLVAIKILHRHLCDDRPQILRFQQEAKLASAIEHPNVIQAYDFGIGPEFQEPFLVMEYLQGSNLASLIAVDGQIDAERFVNIFVQVLDALAAIHAKSVVHGNLNPRHIMIVKATDQPEIARIVDFNLAKIVCSAGQLNRDLKKTTEKLDEVCGTPLYMSPEQWVGKPLDRRSDIYSLGCVMYEALTGQVPLAGNHVLETMYKHMNESPKKLSVSRPDLKISPKIESVVMRALEKDPELRYQTVSEMRHDLQKTRSGFVDRRPWKVRLLAWYTMLRRPLKGWDNAINNVLLVSLSIVIAGCLVGFALMFFRTSQESLWKSLKIDAQKAYSREDFSVAREKFKQCAKVALDTFGEEDPRFIDTLKRLAWVCNASGDYKTGRGVFTKVYKLSPEELSQIKTAQVTLVTLPVAHLGDEPLPEDGIRGLEEKVRKSSETIEKFLGSNDPELIPLIGWLARIYREQKKFNEAETQYLRIFSLQREAEGEISVGAANAHKLLGDLYVEWDNSISSEQSPSQEHSQLEAARENYRCAINIYKRVLGPDAPQAGEVQKLLNSVDNLPDTKAI